MLCEYGCNQEAKFQLKNGKWCCNEHYGKCPVIRKKNSDGLKRAFKGGRKISFDDNARKNAQVVIKEKRILLREWKLNNIPFEQLSHINRKRKILSDQNGTCAICGITTIWNNKPLSFHIDHINGNHSDNRRENLRMVCPNCHSQTNTYGSRNASINGKKKIQESTRRMCSTHREKGIKKQREQKQLFLASNAVVAQSADASA